MGQITTDDPIILIGGMEKTFLVPGWQFSWIIFYDKQKKLSNIKRGVEGVISAFSGPANFI